MTLDWEIFHLESNWSDPTQVHCNSEYINIPVNSFTQPLFTAINGTKDTAQGVGL